MTIFATMDSHVPRIVALAQMDAPTNLMTIDVMMDLLAQQTFVIQLTLVLTKMDAFILQMMTCVKMIMNVHPLPVHQMMKTLTMKVVFSLQMMINATMNTLAQETIVELMVASMSQCTLNVTMDLHAPVIPVIQKMKTDRKSVAPTKIIMMLVTMDFHVPETPVTQTQKMP